MKIIVYIDGMYCKNCMVKVEKLFLIVEGV